MFKDPNERRRRSLFASLAFAGSWLVFEAFVYFLGGSGLIACLYLVPIAAIGSFGALIFFDCNFGKALLIYLIFAFAASIGRGLIITDGWTPKGWIWETNYRSIATGKKNPRVEKKAKPEEKAAETDGATDAKQPAAAPKNEKKESEKPTISREAPKVDPLKSGRRR